MCPIAAPPINDALKALQGCGPPGEHVRVRYSDATGELLIAPGFEAPIGRRGRTRSRSSCLGVGSKRRRPRSSR
ncbi:MAG: hypothetical protein WKH64_04320 [Chloroflexia bacterium]